MARKAGSKVKTGKKGGTAKSPCRRPLRKSSQAASNPSQSQAPKASQPSKEEISYDPTHLRFSETHEWVKIKDRFSIVVGLAEFALNKLTDVLSVDLPEPDEHHYDAGDDVGMIEALNSSLTIHAPVSGTVVASNTALLTSPELICQDPYGRGWLFEMRPDRVEDVHALLDYDEYEGNLPEEDEE